MKTYPIPIIAGNWKMHLNIDQAEQLVDGIRYGLPFPSPVEVVVAPPFLLIPAVVERLKNSYIAIAAQNIHFEENGAFTGECSAAQVKEAGADYVIIGHSERRQYFGETNEQVNRKIKAAFKHDLIPIVCVGETAEEREKGEEARIINHQVIAGLSGIKPQEIPRLVMAYEPVWAIGTGKTASSLQVEEMHSLIRCLLVSLFGGPAAGAVRIIYGGSVKPANSKELLALPNVDGALVGGASLNPQDFIQIIQSIKF